MSPFNANRDRDVKVYLASPGCQQQASVLEDMPVLLSFGVYKATGRWVEKYSQSFSHILIDSGAFSEFNSGFKVELDRYIDWCQWYRFSASAIAGLDDINGDWRKSWKNYQRFELGFPTFHDTDPPEFLDDLIALATERNQWIGIGLKPPRQGKETFIRETCDRIPENIHIHGWALRAYTFIRRLDSVDSTNWFRDAMDLRTMPALRHLTYAETLKIVVKRYKREDRVIKEPTSQGVLEFK